MSCYSVYFRTRVGTDSNFDYRARVRVLDNSGACSMGVSRLLKRGRCDERVKTCISRHVYEVRTGWHRFFSRSCILILAKCCIWVANACVTCATFLGLSCCRRNASSTHASKPPLKGRTSVQWLHAMSQPPVLHCFDICPFLRGLLCCRVSASCSSLRMWDCCHPFPICGWACCARAWGVVAAAADGDF